MARVCAEPVAQRIAAPAPPVCSIVEAISHLLHVAHDDLTDVAEVDEIMKSIYLALGAYRKILVTRINRRNQPNP